MDIFGEGRASLEMASADQPLFLDDAGCEFSSDITWGQDRTSLELYSSNMDCLRPSLDGPGRPLESPPKPCYLESAMSQRSHPLSSAYAFVPEYVDVAPSSEELVGNDYGEVKEGQQAAAARSDAGVEVKSEFGDDKSAMPEWRNEGARGKEHSQGWGPITPHFASSSTGNAQAFADSIKSGWLRKRTSGGWGWRKRWFVLSQTRLCYFADPNNLGVQKMVNFDGGGLKVQKGREINELVVTCHERTLVLRAASQWEAAQWMMAFQIVTQGFGQEWKSNVAMTGTMQADAGKPRRAASLTECDSKLKRKLGDYVNHSSFGHGAEERPSKITSPPASRDASEHGWSSADNSQHGATFHGIRSLDGSAHGYVNIESNSLDNSFHGDWSADSADSLASHRRQFAMLEKAAQSLQAFAIHDGSPSPHPRSPQSPGDPVMLAHPPAAAFPRGGGGPAMGNFESAAYERGKAHGGQGEDKTSAAGSSPAVKPSNGIFAPLPHVTSECMETIPSRQRLTLMRQIENQQRQNEQNPAVVKAGRQAVELTLRLLAAKLFACKQAHRAFRVCDVLEAAVAACAASNSDERYRLQVRCGEEGEDDSPWQQSLSSAYCTSKVLRSVIMKHESTQHQWPMVEEDETGEEVQRGQKAAGDLICALFPFLDMAPGLVLPGFPHHPDALIRGGAASSRPASAAPARRRG